MKENHPRQASNWLVGTCASKVVFFCCLILGTEDAIHAQETVITFTTSTTFTVPNGVSSLKIECWGAGGKGSNVSSTATGTSGGGGGGAYASSQLCVTAGQNFAISIGAGGAGSTLDGGDTFFGNATTVMAKGGKGLAGDVITGGVGGSSAASVGTIKYNGGNGGNRTTYNIAVALGYRSGGGGGGAGSTGAGNNANGLTPGAARIDNGGAGGAGQDGFLLSALAGFSGNPGNNYGAGGSGAGKGLLFSQPTYLGGNGAPGIVRITYEAYSCNASANTTWNGTSWSNGIPDNCKKAIINGNYNTAIHGSISMCSLQINAGHTVTIAGSTYIKTFNEIINNGTLVVANNASLVQEYSSKPNVGMASIYRNTQPMYRYDFTYWSSPVAETTLDDLSPGTFFDKYASWDATTQTWVYNPYGTETMIPGKGYIIRAPQSYSVNPAIKTIFEGVFVGTPNNGTITYPVSGDSTGNKYNLIGNPYPSAINALSFLTANNTTLDGTIYLWTHDATPVNSGGTLSYLQSDYATYNFSGGTAPGSSPIPGNKIGSGQSFFVAGIANGNATFNNSMRLLNDNSQFYRPAGGEGVESVTDEKHRFWLNFSGAEGVFSQILLGYLENATNGLDWGYDGKTLSSNQISLYSLLDQEKLAIQAKALPFSDTDAIPLGYKTTKAGTFSISLDQFEGLFYDQDIFLKDNLLDDVHNLKEEAYTFTSTIGTFHNRFEIIYNNSMPSLKKNHNLSDNIIIYKTTDDVLVINTNSEIIHQIKLYDIAGRLIHLEDGINNSEAYVQNLPQQQQLLIIEILTNSNQKTIKKIIH
ncbi:T9SS sorting signal type C domain-containing protein [Flavobacterium sp. PLA-1-15]|uniref:glycine-rich domain-containing protein n=1 Tax=Flavobacterium sp. PLA-1-15 TaxID=3380533 RepID=UPI003B7AE620